MGLAEAAGMSAGWDIIVNRGAPQIVLDQLRADAVLIILHGPTYVPPTSSRRRAACSVASDCRSRSRQSG